MAALSVRVREILDKAGFDKTLIFASGGFDEFKLAQVVSQGAAIDSFGVGTKVGVSADAPYLDIAYKLVMIDGRPVIKLSRGKKTLAGPKQVYRFVDDKGMMVKDLLARRNEEIEEGTSLLKVFMDNGRRLAPAESLNSIRDRFQEQLAALPPEYRELESAPRYPVSLSQGLVDLQDQVEQRIEESELGES
jgi:nicotinate phosphoribosyltransferase